MTKIEARHAKVNQWIKEGRVMNDAMRKNQKEAAKYQQQLEDRAERILAGLVTVSKPKEDVTVANNTKQAAPEANIKITGKSKYDSLSVAADAILKELQSA